MTENQMDFAGYSPIELTSTQRQVIEVLSGVKSEKYSLVNWFLGAIYAVKNIHNPDRFSQAAQSLRELLEKLPRVFVESEVQESRSGLPDMRRSLYSQLLLDKTRYEGKWKGKTIDARLDKTIRGIDRYLKLDQIPTRKEQIHSVMNKLDPMYETLDHGIRLEKSERFHELWKTFEGLAHHNTSSDEKFFWKQFTLAESLIIDLLAPITAQDQGAIRRILDKTQPEQADFEKLLGLIKRRGANYAYFFKTVDNPIWINLLIENNFFKNPPSVEAAEDGRIIAPLWWPILYLQRVSKQEPKKVVEIIFSLEQTDNPRILREIFLIACDLHDIDLSLSLKPVIKQFLQSSYRWGEEELIINILKKWGSTEGLSRNAAHEIIQYVIAFQPDPKADEKYSRRKENPEAWNTLLEPKPRFEKWEYQKILEKGVRPFAEHEPYQVSRILINAVASMIRLRIHQGEFEKAGDEDYSELWCRRLDKSDRDNQDEKELLLHTLTYACQQVYEQAHEALDALDQALRKYRWKVFTRLRQYLYALYPSDKTLPWIHELILEHEDYSRWEHHYEFQIMIRRASEYFGSRLLSEVERRGIFDAILNGPKKDDFREWMGEQYSEEAFQQHQRNFHRVQLRPFATLLTGEVRSYFDELEGEAQAEIVSDDSYSPYSGFKTVWVKKQSPKSVEDLELFTDQELLTYLNDWDKEHRIKDDWHTEVTIAALVDVFQTTFKGKIIPDSQRLTFWMKHCDKIARPIYVAAMVKAMQETVKGKKLDKLNQWIEFCAWVLSHPDSMLENGQQEARDESRDHPDWRSSRQAVVDFIETCVNKDTNTPIVLRAALADLLQHVCNQFDWRLDNDHPVLLNRDDLISEAFNNTRSRGLKSLVNFSFWVRRQLPEDNLLELTEIFAKRTGENAKIPLTRPEHALLAMHFGDLCTLIRVWATEKKEVFFPQANKSVWRDAFSSYIRFNHPDQLTFEILRSEFEYALENLNILATEKDDGKALIDSLGQHLFTYYIWKMFSLKENDSLLKRFYDKTNDDRKRWALLFDHVGHSLKNSGKNLDKALIDRVIAFFDWRIEVAESLELQEFTFWLEAECLDPEWRLNSYLKILDFSSKKKIGAYIELKTLNKMLQDHLPLVVNCFAKITDKFNANNQCYLLSEDAEPILKAGLLAKDPEIQKNAERARENLLRVGRFEFLNMD